MLISESCKKFLPQNPLNCAEKGSASVCGREFSKEEFKLYQVGFYIFALFFKTIFNKRLFRFMAFARNTLKNKALFSVCTLAIRFSVSYLAQKKDGQSEQMTKDACDYKKIPVERSRIVFFCIFAASKMRRSLNAPKWWNGRHEGLKIPCPLRACGFKSHLRY